HRCTQAHRQPDDHLAPQAAHPYPHIPPPPPLTTPFPYTTLFRSNIRPTAKNSSLSVPTRKPIRFGLARNTTTRSADCITSASATDRKSTRLNSSHRTSSYAVFCLKKKTARHLRS